MILNPTWKIFLLITNLEWLMNLKVWIQTLEPAGKLRPGPVVVVQRLPILYWLVAGYDQYLLQVLFQAFCALCGSFEKLASLFPS